MALPDAALARLLDDLAARDAQVRDEGALGELVEAIMSGEVTAEQSVAVGDRMLRHLRHQEIQARTFAPLILGVLVEVGEWDDRWFEQVRDWYLGEDDLRGHDPERGWLHAVAHGADFFGAVARGRRRPAAEVLDVLARRLQEPTPWVWRDQEDVRLAYALALALIEDPEATTWLDGLAARLSAVTGPPPAWAANTLSTLQALALGLDQQILVDGEPVTAPDLGSTRTAVLEVVQASQPWFWRTATT